MIFGKKSKTIHIHMKDPPNLDESENFNSTYLDLQDFV